MEEPAKEISDIAVDEQIEDFIRTIPRLNRRETVQAASQGREAFIARVWQEERSKLPQELVEKQGLAGDVQGWNRYLKLGFDQDEYRGRHGFEDWSAKYLAQMLSLLEDDKRHTQQGMGQFTKVKRSFYEYYFGGGGVDPEIWWGRRKPLDSHSLLVHSISKRALSQAINSGVLGRGGMSEIAMCQDRIVYDRGYVVIFQANELIDAGYPLLQINEDPRDAKILKEWRLPMPVDINLARLVVPTPDIPDRANASKAQIATSYFGEEYLRGIERL